MLTTAELRADVDDAPSRWPEDPPGGAAQGARHAHRRRREAADRAVALRRHGEGDQGTLSIDEAVASLVEEAG